MSKENDMSNFNENVNNVETNEAITTQRNIRSSTFQRLIEAIDVEKAKVNNPEENSEKALLRTYVLIEQLEDLIL